LACTCNCSSSTHTHTHAHTHIYICVCVCVCTWTAVGLYLQQLKISGCHRPSQSSAKISIGCSNKRAKGCHRRTNIAPAVTMTVCCMSIIWRHRHLACTTDPVAVRSDICREPSALSWRMSGNGDPHADWLTRCTKADGLTFWSLVTAAFTTYLCVK